MIDERQEELAALYALDLLDGAERAQFETALARDPILQALVQELRESATALAYAAPSAPVPAALRERVLSAIEARSATEKMTAPDNVLRPPPSLFRSLAPWAAAACLALTAARVGQLYFAARNENALLRQQQAIADVALKSAQTLLESERLVSQRQLVAINDTTRQLEEAKQLGNAAETRRLAAERQLADTRTQLAQSERQIADAQAQLGDRDRQVATLTQRVNGLTGAAQEADRQLGAAQMQIAKLTDEAKNQAALADFKITTLASMLKNSPQALAVAVWNPAKQEGVVTIEKMPALAADQNLELWVVEDKAGAKPVSAGVIHVDASGITRVSFKPVSPVGAVAAFAVSREKNDGARAHAAPGEVIMLGKSH